MFHSRLRAAALVAGLGFVGTAHAVIYGDDNRTDIYQVPKLRDLARAVAVAVPNIFLEKAADGTYTVTETESLEKSGGSFVCPGERFDAQPSMGVCSGFLIGDRYLVTAGHCVLPNGVVDHKFHPFCEGFSWYFDYNMKTPTDFPSSGIPASRIYGCKSILRAENINEDANGISGNDFALIELDRPVAADMKPLPLLSRPVRRGDFVYTVGHPTGLPAKYSGISPIIALDQPHYFSVNLDTEGGNSGGGVFNILGEVVGILVSGHDIDYYHDPKDLSGCLRPNRCDPRGQNCIEDAKLQRSNFVQKIETVLPYLPISI